MGEVNEVVGLSATLGAASVLGIAAQRAAEIADGLWSLKTRTPVMDAKSATKSGVMAGLTFLFGLAGSLFFDVRVVQALDNSFNAGFGDNVISALVITAGSETANSILKAAEHVKDRAKPGDIPEAVLHGDKGGSNE